MSGAQPVVLPSWIVLVPALRLTLVVTEPIVSQPPVDGVATVGPVAPLTVSVTERAAPEVFWTQVRLIEDLGYNKLLGTEAGRQQAAKQYQATRSGPLAAPPCEIVGFFKTRPELDRPDAQFQIAPYSILPLQPGQALQVEREPGMMCVAYLLRPESEGSLRVTSADPDAPLDIDPNYFATDHDRSTAVGVFRGIRRLFATGPLAQRILGETVPGDAIQTDQEIIDAGLTTGNSGYHTVGTCAMGPNDDDVVDSRLRVRGVPNLRVVDASVLPTMVSGNLNGPVTALAWRAADLVVAS
jgi:choline dehydrogenase